MARPGTRRPNAFLLGTLIVFAVLLLLFLSVPLISLVVTSLRTPGIPGIPGITLVNYRVALTTDPFIQALGNSLVLALFSSLVAMGIGLLCAGALTHVGGEGLQRRLILLLNMAANFNGLSLALSVLLMFGGGGLVWVMLSRFGVESMASFTPSVRTLLALTYCYFQIPMAVLLLYPAFHGIRRDWREAATMLGAYAPDFWCRVGVPVLLPSALATFTILFANAMGAYAAAYQLVTSDTPLLPLQISALITGGLHAMPGLGSALAVLLLCVLIVSVLLSDWAERVADRSGGGA